MRLYQMNGNWQDVALHLSEVLGRSIRFENIASVSGGCINQTWKVTDKKGCHWFIKTNEPDLQNMFRTESDGLNDIHQSMSVRVPKVFASGATSAFSYLVLEYIPLRPSVNQKLMGKQLAQMHQYTSNSQQFGWKRDNTIGSTVQSNSLSQSWLSFWKNERLLFQLNLAKSKGYSNSAFDLGVKLSDNLAVFFSDYQPKPSLVHGDLWGGNCGNDAELNPVIYDPAVYYGDREVDIAMTELFGGFDGDFYDTYNESLRLDAGYKTRKVLYNLYHILNHFNLFGGGYATQAENMTKQLLAEL